MYRSIVVGTDGSDTATTAVRHAFGLAVATGAAVHVVTAWSRVPALVLSSGVLSSSPAGGVATDDGAWIGPMHDRLVVDGERLGLTVTPYAVEDSPAHALLDLADRVDADVVVVGNQGMAGLRGRLGSVPNTVAHKARCAVLVVPTG
ncbi:MAG: UspA domain protein [Frankiales bacterium]|nr:UspA domain protein [Frankiales bacterium]